MTVHLIPFLKRPTNLTLTEQSLWSQNSETLQMKIKVELNLEGQCTL